MVKEIWNGYNRFTGELYSDDFYKTEEWWMIHPRSGYYRAVRTKQENTRYIQDYNDEYTKLYNIRLRQRRNNGLMNPWNLEDTPSCYNTKSWKKLYKCKKSYEKKFKRRALINVSKNRRLEYFDDTQKKRV